MEESNFFDGLGFQDPEETKRILDQQKTDGEKLDQLIHQVFSQNTAGAELLDIWVGTLVMTPTAQPGMDSIDIGIHEGIKTFVRNILLTVSKVEKDE